MKYIIKPIIFIVAWPIIAFILLIGCLLWLGFYAFGNKAEMDAIAMYFIQPTAYCLWHLKVKEEK